jgi:hypothetical protein
MHFGFIRYSTFTNWPNTTPVSARDLAIQGFVYTGEADRVRCIHCNGSLHSWEQGDIVEVEHRRHFPHCPSLSYDETSRTEIPADDDTQEMRVATPSPPTIAQEIAEEAVTQPEGIVCRVCLLTERDTVLLPCFHLVSCTSCRLRLEKCPVCRQSISGSMKVFLS